MKKTLKLLFKLILNDVFMKTHNKLIARQKECHLYLITPPNLHLETFRVSLETILAADNAGLIRVLQIRQKNLPSSELQNIALSLKPICTHHNVLLLINDSPAIAHATSCDGVHLGQKDPTYENARSIIGKNRIVGITCHNSIDLAVAASQKGADYVAFGAFFPTRTKKVEFVAKPQILRIWKNFSKIPSVAIGGITPENCHNLVKAGADFLAVVSSVWGHPDGPSTAISAFKKAITEAQIN